MHNKGEQTGEVIHKFLRVTRGEAILQTGAERVTVCGCCLQIHIMFLTNSRACICMFLKCTCARLFSPHAVASGDTLIRGLTPDWFFAGFLPVTCPWCDKSNYHRPAAHRRDRRKERTPSHTSTRTQSRHCPKHARRPSHLDR